MPFNLTYLYHIYGRLWAGSHILFNGLLNCIEEVFWNSFTLWHIRYLTKRIQRIWSEAFREDCGSGDHQQQGCSGVALHGCKYWSVLSFIEAKQISSSPTHVQPWILWINLAAFVFIDLSADLVTLEYFLLLKWCQSSAWCTYWCTWCTYMC